MPPPPALCARCTSFQSSLPKANESNPKTLNPETLEPANLQVRHSAGGACDWRLAGHRPQFRPLPECAHAQPLPHSPQPSGKLAPLYPVDWLEHDLM